MLEEEFNPLISHISTTTSWTPDTAGLLISDHRLEAGRSSDPGDTNDVYLSHLQIWIAIKQYKKLPYTFTYLFSFFLLADVGCHKLIWLCGVFTPGCLQSINTTTTLVFICQNDLFQFSFLQVTYLGLAQGITSAIG